MKILYFDCFSGASGDMLLGALLDAGVPLADVRRALGTLAISAETIWTERVARAGLAATKFCVRGEDPPPDHAHDHDHHHDGAHLHQHDHPHTHDHEAVGHHAHRTLEQIYALIDGSGLDAPGRDRAKHLFATLGAVEASIHGTSIDKVHLHEVGSLDSIIDIVGFVFAMETLDVDRVISSPLNVGSGTVRSTHGLYPVPAPASMRLLEGVPIYAGARAAELVTPTGALLVTHYASAYGPIPPMRVRRIGYGAGSRDFEDAPNVLRVLIGEDDQTAPAQSVAVVEAEIDDMNPQIFGLLMDRLLDDGALDVFYTAIQMKKNRPGTLVTVIAPPDRRAGLTATIFRETTTIGVRYREMTRECLDRETVTVDTPLGPIRFKIASRDGEVQNASPEFEDCARIARERDLPLKDVQAAASKAFLDSSSRRRR